MNHFIPPQGLSMGDEGLVSLNKLPSKELLLS